MYCTVAGKYRLGRPARQEVQRVAVGAESYHGPAAPTGRLAVCDLQLEVGRGLGQRAPRNEETGQAALAPVHEDAIHHGEPLYPGLGLLLRGQRRLSVQRNIATPRNSLSLPVSWLPLPLCSNLAAAVSAGKVNERRSGK